MRISTSELQRSEYDSGLSHTSSHILQDDEHGIGMPQHLTVDIDSESVAFDDIETVGSHHLLLVCLSIQKADKPNFSGLTFARHLLDL